MTMRPGEAATLLGEQFTRSSCSDNNTNHTFPKGKRHKVEGEDGRVFGPNLDVYVCFYPLSLFCPLGSCTRGLVLNLSQKLKTIAHL